MLHHSSRQLTKALKKFNRSCSSCSELNGQSSLSTRREFHSGSTSSKLLDACRVIVSQSTNPYFNLATEDYLFSVDMDVQEYQTLFLWRNDKTVVIGKNQNPFKECNLSRMEQDNVNLVRRRSGGGAVYQDLVSIILDYITLIFKNREIVFLHSSHQRQIMQRS